jgi:DNA polymerase (family 10)
MYSNSDVAEYLTNIATAYEIKKKSRFQIAAYQNAADTVLTYPEPLFDIWKKNPALLDSIPNIGPSILKKIDYLFKHHKPYPALNTVFKNIHPAVFTFTKINGIGPLIAHKLTQTFKFPKNPTAALEKIIDLAQKGKIKTLPTFGEKSEKMILDNTLSFMGRKNRLPLADAQKLASRIIVYLHSRFPDTEFIPLGSLRRLTPSVGDIDIAAAANNPKEIISHFIKYPETIEVIATGKEKASIRLLHDIHIDLMIKPVSSFGALLQHFTGSRQHNILLRRHALKLNFSLSEYGIRDLKTRHLHHFSNETDFYRFLDLKYIPPQERVGEDELTRYLMI